MRPTLAIIPLALLLSWFSPTPTGELASAASLGLSEARTSTKREPSPTEQFAEAWEAFQRSDFMQSSVEVPQRR